MHVSDSTLSNTVPRAINISCQADSPTLAGYR